MIHLEIIRFLIIENKFEAIEILYDDVHDKFKLIQILFHIYILFLNNLIGKLIFLIH